MILSYFCDPSKDGFYILANEYIKNIINEEGIEDTINMVNLNRHQKEVFDRLATNQENENSCFFISDPNNLSNLEKDKILLLRSGNPSIYSFAAEINYHARMSNCLKEIMLSYKNGSEIPYSRLIELLSLNKSLGMLSTDEVAIVSIVWGVVNMTSTKISFLYAVKNLFNHAVVSDAGTGTSGTAFTEQYLPHFLGEVNLDILIEDVFYDEGSMLVRQARWYHDEANAYNY